MVGHRLKMLRGENAQTRHFVRGQRDPNPGPNPRHSGRATRDPESICFPMDSRVRGNDGNRVGGHYVKQAAYSSCPSGRVQSNPELGPNPRHSGRATRDPESICFPMDSRLRGNDGNRAGGHCVKQAVYSSCPSGRVQSDLEPGSNPRHSGRATRDPESSCPPMDSRPTLSRGQALRGNDGDRVGGHWAMQNELTEQACALDAATRLRRTFGRQVAANLKELGYGN